MNNVVRSGWNCRDGVSRYKSCRPYAGHYSAAKERTRQQLNQWIRTAGVFDAVVDFDAVLRDPGHPGRMLAAFDSGDHLHPGDAGYRAMAVAFDIAPLLAPTEKPPLH